MARATPPPGLPVLRPSPSSMRAAASTPAERVGACVARFPTRSSLPRVAGGSASTSQVSGPARRSLTLRPAWSLSRQGGPLASKCFSRCRCLHRPLRLLPAGATVAGRDSHPLRDGAFHGARRVDDWRGGGRRMGVAVPGGFRSWPVPHSPPWLRFQSPLVEPDVRISRIRLSDEIMPSPTEGSPFAVQGA